MENQSKERRLLETRLSTTVFGSKFKVSRFTSFLSWTGMILCVMMMIVSLALLTIPNDLKKKHPRFVDDPKDFESLNLLWFTMYGVGAVLMTLFLPLLKMCYVLRKRNVKKDVEGVMKILKIICYVGSGVELLIIFSLVAFVIWISTAMRSSIATVSILINVLLVLITSLKIHGIRTKNPNYIKAFIIIQYIAYILVLIGGIGGSICLSAIFSQFWIFLLGVLFMMCSTFIWIFVMGFIITLNTLLAEKGRSGNGIVYSMMEEVTGE